METNTNNTEDRNIVIIGGGTAGFAAGVYTSRAMLEPILITGDALGGQLSLTLDLENYPGFFGNEASVFIQGMQEQAERFGTEVTFDTVTAVDFSRHPFAVTTYEKEYRAKSVIICTGASPRTLDIPVKRDTADAVSPIVRRVTGFSFKTNGSSSLAGATQHSRKASS